MQYVLTLLIDTRIALNQKHRIHHTNLHGSPTCKYQESSLSRLMSHFAIQRRQCLCSMVAFSSTAGQRSYPPASQSNGQHSQEGGLPLDRLLNFAYQICPVASHEEVELYAPTAEFPDCATCSQPLVRLEMS